MGSNRGFDIESLKEALQDNRLWLACGIVKGTEMVEDRSLLRCTVNIFPENREIIARMTWDSVGPDAGIFQFPQKDDLVLVGMSDGDEETAFVLKRLTSRTDTIPLEATVSDLVLRALAGKKAHLTSNTRINLSKEGGDPAEPVVLGLVMKAFCDRVIEILTRIERIGVHPFGPVFMAPEVKQDLWDAQELYLTDEDTNILSQLSFSERGD